MIKQLEYSESVGVPRDQRTARAALRLLGAFEAGTAVAKAEPAPEPTRTVAQALDDIFRRDK